MKRKYKYALFLFLLALPLGIWGMLSRTNGEPTEIIRLSENVPTADIQEFQFRVDWIVGKKNGSENEALYQPRVALGVDQSLYVLDMGQNRLMKFTLDGQFVKKIGRAGQGEHEFLIPNSISVDPAGNIFIQDAKNMRVKRFDKDLNLTSMFSMPSIRGPIVVDSKDQIYMLSMAHDKLFSVLDRQGVELFSFGQQLSYTRKDGRKMGYHYACSIDKNDVVYTVFAGKDSCLFSRFNPELDKMFISQLSLKEIQNDTTGKPQDFILAHGKDNYFYLNLVAQSVIYKIDYDGKIIGRIHLNSVVPDLQLRFVFLAVDELGSIYITERTQSKVYKLKKSELSDKNGT